MHTTHTGALPTRLILTGFVPNPHLPQLWHASDLVNFGPERAATALLDLPEENQEQKGCQERSKYDEKAKQERRGCWGAAASAGSRGGGGGSGGAGARRKRR